MRQMDDNLIVGIATIQAIVMSLLFTAASWLKIHGQGGIGHRGHQVSFFLLVRVCLCKEVLTSQDLLGLW